MPDHQKNAETVSLHSYAKVQPLQEGSIVKGGINTISQITERPPAPPILSPKPIIAQPSTDTGHKSGA
jgi:hypothetical protein